MKAAILILAAALPAFAGSKHDHHAELPKSPAAMQFKRLAAALGAWQAKGPDGKPILAWYKLIAGGTVLHQTMRFGDEPEMVSVWHLNGKHLDMTHYCSANNQPRMRAVPETAKKPEDLKAVEFAYVDATNLESPEASRMSNMKLVIEDADHITEYWTWEEKGKKQTIDIKYARVKN